MAVGPVSQVICRVNDVEFESANSFDDTVVLTESSLKGSAVAIAFRPRDEWPKAFKFYRLDK
jgi:hypothetical protein